MIYETSHDNGNNNYPTQVFANIPNDMQHVTKSSSLVVSNR